MSETIASMVPMSFAQSERAHQLYLQAKIALEALSEERLNLDGLTRSALNRARGDLEDFDALRLMQPKKESV